MNTPSVTPSTLAEFSVAIIAQPDPAEKVKLARQVHKTWQTQNLPAFDSANQITVPEQPGRPLKPVLVSPRDMPRRRIGSRTGLIALVHSLVHIELNALDMAFDLLARFCAIPLPREFLDEALKVGLEEAEHFEMINHRLEELGALYGDLPAHGELWGAVLNTRHDLLARLAIVPLVLEARGLDVSPKMINQMKSAGEIKIAKSMDQIYRDEITHVAFGVKWFKFICAQQKCDPEQKYQTLVRQHYRGAIKPPFNTDARALAGLTPGFYSPLAK